MEQVSNYLFRNQSASTGNKNGGNYGHWNVREARKKKEDDN
jgi:hypothetical protein